MGANFRIYLTDFYLFVTCIYLFKPKGQTLDDANNSKTTGIINVDCKKDTSKGFKEIPMAKLMDILFVTP
jgi:hypothetical protein